jgi:hypothetical protein
VKPSPALHQPGYLARLAIGILMILVAVNGISTLAACTAEGGTPASAMRSFMQAADKMDIDRAYASFVPTEATRDEIEKLVGDQVLFQGFQDIKVDRWVVFAPPDSQRGRLTGTISYSSGHTGKFDAVLAQTPDGWRLVEVNITAPGERIIQFGIQRAESTITPSR